MISPDLLKGPTYRTAQNLANLIRADGDSDFAWDIEDMAEGGELPVALFAAMEYLIERDIPVSYEDYQILQDEFADTDEPDWCPKSYWHVADNEAEVFKKLKLADEWGAPVGGLKWFDSTALT